MTDNKEDVFSFLKREIADLNLVYSKITTLENLRGISLFDLWKLDSNNNIIRDCKLFADKYNYTVDISEDAYYDINSITFIKNGN